MVARMCLAAQNGSQFPAILPQQPYPQRKVAVHVSDPRRKPGMTLKRRRPTLPPKNAPRVLEVVEAIDSCYKLELGHALRLPSAGHIVRTRRASPMACPDWFIRPPGHRHHASESTIGTAPSNKTMDTHDQDEQSPRYPELTDTLPCSVIMPRLYVGGKTTSGKRSWSLSDRKTLTSRCRAPSIPTRIRLSAWPRLVWHPTIKTTSGKPTGWKYFLVGRPPGRHRHRPRHEVSGQLRHGKRGR